MNTNDVIKDYLAARRGQGVQIRSGAPTPGFARIGLIRQALAYRDQRPYAPPKLIGDFP